MPVLTWKKPVNAAKSIIATLRVLLAPVFRMLAAESVSLLPAPATVKPVPLIFSALMVFVAVVRLLVVMPELTTTVSVTPAALMSVAEVGL